MNNPETGELVSPYKFLLPGPKIITIFDAVGEGMSLSFRCPVGTGAARLGTVNSPQLPPLMKNAVLSVSDSICVSKTKCSGMSHVVC